MSTSDIEQRMSLVQGRSLIYLPNAPQTLAEMLQRAAFQASDRGIHFITDNGAEKWISFPELLLQAESFLAGLQARGIRPGQKLIIQLSDKHAFLIAYWGCILGGIVPAPLASTLSLDPTHKTFEKFLYIWRLLDCPLVVSDYMPPGLAKALGEPDSSEAQMLKTAEATELTVVSVEAIETVAEEAKLHAVKPKDLAFLQFTSGSTGNPKGVMLSHANLIANIHSIVQGGEYNDQDLAFNWMPFYHDMGLIGGHLALVFAMTPSLQMAPFTFIKKPRLWVEKMHEHRVTFTASPNFGYKRVLEKVTDQQLAALDLSCVRMILNGAEPISIPLIKAFNEKLGRLCQLRPTAMTTVYGMAEACLGVTLPPWKEEIQYNAISRKGMSIGSDIQMVDEQATDAVCFADEGFPLNGIDLRIVDDKDQLLPQKVIGNIQMRGPNVTKGYYQNQLASEALHCEEWARTGDLGFIHDGRLCITGRAKDIIFIDGQNFFAHDLEQIGQKVEGVNGIMVIGFQDEGTGLEQVAVFVVIEPKYARQTGLSKKDAQVTVLIGVQQAINRFFGFSPSFLVPVKASEIPKTTSGKLQRFTLVRQFREGQFEGRCLTLEQLLVQEVKKPPTPPKKLKKAIKPPSKLRSLPHRDRLEERLRQDWSQVLKIPEARIGLEDSFFDLGGSSVKAVEVMALTEDFTGCAIPQHAFAQHHTISAIIDFLLENQENLCTGLGTKVAEILHSDEVPPSTASTTSAQDEHAKDIAIIGMSCRFPGAYNVRRFWESLSGGRDCVTEIPEDRWAIKDFYDPEAQAPNKSYSKWGGFIEEIRYFDASFFKIKPEEAEQMDPQQRLFLEIAWHALENAGYANPTSKRIGVFVGAGFNGYIENFLNRFDEVDIHESTITGNLLNMIAARVAHTFNLNGPALTIDTACSSSLVAAHLACQSIRCGECEMALIGGVQLNLTAAPYILFSQTGALSPQGRCKSFSSEANGFVPGEGAGAIILKPYQKALADGDRIYALIKGSAVNNDGHSLGIMAPNPQGHEQVIRDAYERAQVEPHTVSYVEAHGTGSPIGDMIEVKALAKVFGDSGVQNQHCAMGSVKGNIGHLMSASGVSALIKTVLALEHQQIPPTLHCDVENPAIRFNTTPFFVNRTLHAWDVDQEKRRAGIHSFGFGGTNCHMVLEEAPKQDTQQEQPAQNCAIYQTVTFSAHHADAFDKEISNLKGYLRNHRETQLIDICYTQNARRAHFWEYRAAFATNSIAHLRLLLTEFDRKQAPKQLREKKIAYRHNKKKPSRKSRAVVFLFSGQGSQFPEMARMLYNLEPVFSDTVDRCQEIIAPIFPYNIVELLTKPVEEELLHRADVAEPLLFILDYALARLWMNWGLYPEALIGHSIGEYIAACISGAMAPEDALKIVVEGGKLIQAQAPGSMLSLFISLKEAQEILQSKNFALDFAVHNGPYDHVVAGSEKEVDRLGLYLAQQKIKHNRLRAPHGFHSRAMDPVLNKFKDMMEDIPWGNPEIPLVSNITGTFLGEGEVHAEYWAKHLRNTIHFDKGIAFLLEQGYCNFLEIGAKNQLSLLVTNIASDQKIWVGSSMPNPKDSEIEDPRDRRKIAEDEVYVEEDRRSSEDRRTPPHNIQIPMNQRAHLVQLMGNLYTKGIDFDWSNCFHRLCGAEGTKPVEPHELDELPNSKKSTAEETTVHRGRLINIPTYPFQRKEAWVQSREDSESQATAPASASSQKLSLIHTGLGKYQLKLEPDDPLFSDFRFQGQPAISTGGLCEITCRAYEQAYGRSPNVLRQLVFEATWNPEMAVDILFSQDQKIFYVVPKDSEKEAQAYATGIIDHMTIPTRPNLDLKILGARMANHYHAEEIYQYLDQQGISFSSRYRNIQSIKGSPREALVELAYDGPTPNLSCPIIPGLLEAALRGVIGCLFASQEKEEGVGLLPRSLRGICMHQQPNPKHAYAYVHLLSEPGEESIRCDISLCNPEGEICTFIEGFVARKFRKDGTTKKMFVDTWEDPDQIYTPPMSIPSQTNASAPLLKQLRDIERHQEMSLAPVSAPAPIQEPTHLSLQAFLIELTAERLSLALSDIDPETTFLDMGADSVLALAMVKELEAKLMVELSPTLLFEYPSISELSAYLEEIVPEENRYPTQIVQSKVAPPSPESPPPPTSAAAPIHSPEPIVSEAAPPTIDPLKLLEETIAHQRKDQMALFNQQLQTLRSVFQTTQVSSVPTGIEPAQPVAKPDPIPPNSSPSIAEPAPELAQTNPDPLAQGLRAYLLRIAAEKLAQTLDDEVDPEMNFLEMGADSVTALGLAKELEKTLQIELPPTLLFEYSNINSLEEYLRDLLGEAIK